MWESDFPVELGSGLGGVLSNAPLSATWRPVHEENTMPTELLVLALAAALLMVHVMLAGHIRTRQYGTEWNMGARDAEMPPLNPLAGRLLRSEERRVGKGCRSRWWP